eukprot:TRINITY_DN6158_c0_g1_i1.p1 TRINITY_DN6158_c0_g1~~TRINITY_DN6158_c0_g1_i1.p1  ORF type:complete len:482 (+),score=108.04 TRINITY_DN6158_c0_g1_i1:172-1617(+)
MNINQTRRSKHQTVVLSDLILGRIAATPRTNTTDTRMSWRSYAVGGVVAVAGFQYVLSELLHQWRSRSKLREATAAIRAVHDPQQVLKGLRALDSLWDLAKREDSPDGIFIIHFGLSPVINLLQQKDCVQTFSRETISTALKIITKTCEEASARRKVAALKGVDTVMKVFSEISQFEERTPSIENLLEEVAITMAQITHVDPKEVVLPDDVPAGSEGALRLVGSKNFGAFVGMLLLDVGNSGYFTAFTKCLKNVSYLAYGAKRLREVQVLRYLYPLLDRQQHELRDMCTILLWNMVDKDVECRNDMYKNPPSKLLKPFVTNPTQKAAKSAEAVLAVIGILLRKGNKEQQAIIARDLIQNEMLEEISVIRTKSKELKLVRAQAEDILTQLKEMPDPEIAAQAQTADSKYAREVQAAVQRETIEARKAQQRKQQFQMQMLLGGMGGGGGGEMSEEDMYMAQLMGGMGGMGMGGDDGGMFGMEE